MERRLNIIEFKLEYQKNCGFNPFEYMEQLNSDLDILQEIEKDFRYKAENDLKVMFHDLKWHSKSLGQEWLMEFTAIISCSPNDTTNPGELHIHLLLSASPANEVKECINKYWKKHHGNVIIDHEVKGKCFNLKKWHEMHEKSVCLGVCWSGLLSKMVKHCS
jgi:hypothetical protein